MCRAGGPCSAGPLQEADCLAGCRRGTSAPSCRASSWRCRSAATTSSTTCSGTPARLCARGSPPSLQTPLAALGRSPAWAGACRPAWRCTTSAAGLQGGRACRVLGPAQPPSGPHLSRRSEACVRARRYLKDSELPKAAPQPVLPQMPLHPAYTAPAAPVRAPQLENGHFVPPKPTPPQQQQPPQPQAQAVPQQQPPQQVRVHAGWACPVPWLLSSHAHRDRMMGTVWGLLWLSLTAGLSIIRM